MRVAGYRLKGYDATYEKTTFNVSQKQTGKSRVLEVLDESSGVTFIFELEDDRSRRKHKPKSKGKKP